MGVLQNSTHKLKKVIIFSYLPSVREELTCHPDPRSLVKKAEFQLYPTSVKSERRLDGVVHVVGVLSAIFCAVILLMLTAGLVTSEQIFALALYSGALVATFVASAVYHLSPWHDARPILRRLDHAAIYLKIAGTYTPFVVMLDTILAYLILAVVWGLALLGMVLKLFFWRVPGRFGPPLYLLMGWLCLPLVWSIWSMLPGQVLAFMTAGGLIYTGGVVLYKSKRPYSTAAWHGCVVVASACFWFAILIGTLAGVELR